MVERDLRDNAATGMFMIQGTGSHVGKSVLTAALCRIFSRKGLRVAPFKSQNMALNSYVTPCGGEIGRAQAFQAEAAGIEARVDLNPVLLKPTGDRTSQVVIHGKVHSTMDARTYHAFKREAMGFVLESLERLKKDFDLIIIEGAGSPAEINLRENDIANMGLALKLGCPVLLAGDIDRGGVFASLFGTVELLEPEERDLIKGLVINKFRGDRDLLTSGIDFIEERLGKDVLGVVPYFEDISLPEEDGVSLTGAGSGTGESPEECGERLKISIVRLPRISNFTDFDPLRDDPGVELNYIKGPGDLGMLAASHLVILPGTKNVIGDLEWLSTTGIGGAVLDYNRSGGTVFGICGGFQMLGSSVADPHGVEGGVASMRGLSLIGAETVLGREKELSRVKARCWNPQGGEPIEVSGYEIHMGETKVEGQGFSRLTSRGAEAVEICEGVLSDDHTVMGSYIHGLFDNDLWREAVLKRLAARAGIERTAGESFRDERELSIERLADTVEGSLDMAAILAVAGLDPASC